jgi:hypothetical protein
MWHATYMIIWMYIGASYEVYNLSYFGSQKVEVLDIEFYDENQQYLREHN